MVANATASTVEVARVPAGYGKRGAAAVLDLVVLTALLTVMIFVWGQFEPLRGEVPTQFKAVFLLAAEVYLVSSTLAGCTLGMRALGLRILRVDHSGPPGVVRAFVRSTVLLAIVWCLLETPLLLLAYGAWMLFNRQRQMLHDQVASTVVVQSNAVVVSVDAVAEAADELATVEPTQAQGLLTDLSRLRRRVFTDLYPASIPLLILGVLALGGGLAAGIDTASGSWGLLFSVGFVYWVLAGPLGLTATAWWYRRLRLAHGVQPGDPRVVAIVILTGCLALVPTFWMFGPLITAIGFLAVAITRRSTVLALASIIFGLAAGAEHPLSLISIGLSHVLPASPIPQHGGSLTFALLGSLLIATGLLTRHRERTG